MIVRIIGLFVVGLIVAVIIALSQVNLETLRGNVLAILRDATGMPVEIDGAVSWKFSLRPRIELNQVRIPNAEWARHEYAFSADRIDVRINLLSLFQDRPTIQNIRVYDATVSIEKNDAGNYSIPMFMKKHAKTDDDTSDAVADTGPAKYPFEDPGLGGIEIRNLVAHVLGETYSVAGFNIRYFPHIDRREYAGWIRSETQVYPFIVSYSQYNAERKIYPVRIALSTGGNAMIANIALEGTSLAPIDFKVKGDIPNLAAFGALVGLHWPDVPSVALDIAGGYDWNKLTLRKSSITVRDTTLVFSGEYDWTKKTPAITLNLSSGRLDVAKLFPELYGHAKARPNRALNVFKDVPLYGTMLRGHNINLNLNLEHFIVYRDFDIQNLSAAIKLHGDKARVDASALIGGGAVNVGGDVNINEKGVLDVVAAARGHNISVGQILAEIRNDNFITGLSVDVSAYLKGHGATLSELMSTATGPVQIYSVAPGWIHSALVANLYGSDFLTTLRHNIEDLFRSEKQHNQIKISCASINAKLRGGRIDTQHGVALETNAINVRLAGNIDLGAETLKLSLTTVPVRGLKLSLTGNVVNSIEITGNLAEPDVRISGAAVAGKVASATGLGLLLAPFTGGIGLVAGAGVGLLAGDLLENWLADDTPCKTAMKRGAPAMRDDAAWINAPLNELTAEMLGSEENNKTKE